MEKKKTNLMKKKKAKKKDKGITSINIFTVTKRVGKKQNKHQAEKNSQYLQ